MDHDVVEMSGLKARLFSRDRVDRSERGDSMIEVLLALIVLGLTSVALIVAFSTTLSASAEHRSLTSADIAINDYTQSVTAGIEANQDLFTCPTPALSATANAAYYNTELAIASPAPYSPTIQSVQYWNGTGWSSSCIANASEMITVSVGSGSHLQTMQFVVDSPTSGSNYVGGAPTGIEFITPASAITATSGASLPVNPVVEVQFGNSPDATDLTPINLTLDSGGSPTTLGTLSGCSSNDINGVVTYTGCTISLTTSSASAVDFTIVASLQGTTYFATSPQIAVSGSTSSYLSFTTQPQAGDSGSPMTTEPVITAYQGGTTTVDATVMSITLTTSGSLSGQYQLSSCSGLSGYSTTSELNGVVTVTDAANHGGTFAVSGCDFAGQFYYDVNSGAVGTPYTMTASAPNVTSATSQPFAATGYGAAAQMEYIVEPTGGIGTTTGATSATLNSFEIAIEDSWGNTLSGQGQAAYAGSIAVKVTSTGTALTCTPSSSGGIFTFSGCTSLLGSGLTLTATATGTGSAGVTPEVSTAFNVSGPVASLVWYGTSAQAQPVAGASGSVMTNQPVLAYEDAHGIVATAYTASVSYTSTYASGTESTVSPNGLLTTCSNLPPVNGIINAGNCTFVGLVGTNYTMQATTTSGPTITSSASSTFSPTGPGPASQLVFTPSPGVEPVAAAAGSPFTTEPVVVVEDVGGNVVTSASAQVEMNSYLWDSLNPTNPSVQSGTLLNCSTLAPVGGAVSLIPVSGYLEVEGSCAFGGTVATNYQLVASSPGLTSAVSSIISPTAPGPIAQVLTSGCATPINFQASCTVSASVDDAYNNVVTSFSGAITFAQSGGTGTVSGFGSPLASSGSASDTITGTNIGTVPVVASIANPALSSLPLTVTVLPIPQNITWTPPPTQTWVAGGAGTFSLGTASDSSGSIVTFASSTLSVCTVSGTTVTMLTAGVCTITPTAPAKGNYSTTFGTASDITINQIAQATLTVSSANTDSYPWAITLATTGGSGTGAVTYAVTNGSANGCADPGGVLTATSAGTCNVTATKASDVDYLSATSATQVVTFTESPQATLTVSSASTDSYPWSITLSTTGGTGSGAVTYAVTNGTASGCADPGGVLTASSAGTCNVTATKASDGDYLSATSALQVVTFTETAQATLTVSSASTIPYPWSVNLSTSGGTGSGAVSYAFTDGTATCALNSDVLTASGTGTCTVTATKASDGDYLSTTSVAQTVTFTKASQGTLTMSSASTATYPTWSITLATAGGNGAGAVSYAFTDGTTTCALNGGVLSATTAGTCNVTATKAADTDYNAATSATQTVTFAEATQATLSMSSASTDSYPWSITLSASGGTGTGAISFAVTNGTANGCADPGGVLTATSAGTCNVTATRASDGHYFSATSANQVVTFTEAAQAALTMSSASSDTYPWSITLSTSGGTGSGAVSYAVANGSANGCADPGGVLTATSAGTCTVTATKASDGDYTSVSSAPQTVTFTKANQAALTMSSASTDAYPWSITLSTSGGNGGGAVTYAVANVTASGCADPGGILTATTSGTCTVTATKALDADYNAVSSSAQTVTFTKAAPTVTVTDTTDPTGVGTGTLVLTATVTGASGGTPPSGTLTWTVTGPTSGGCTTSTLTAGSGQSTATCTITSPAAGTYTAKAAYAGDTNYTALTSPSTFGMYIGATAATVPSGTYYYTINNATSTGSTTNTANTIAISPAETLTGITMTYNSGASGVNQTVTVGKITTSPTTYTATTMACTVQANTTESCSYSGTYAISSGSAINMAVVGNNLHTYFWIVTFTTTP